MRSFASLRMTGALLWMTRSPLRTSLGIIVLGLFTFAACVTVEETHRRQLAPVPDSYMNQLGVRAYAEVKGQEHISHDAKQTAQVLDIGKRVAKATGKDFNWEFSLFDDKQVNAFCLPGGKVGVYTGILPIAKTNAGLAAVLGHEIGHAIARHAGERMSEQLLLTGALISVDILMGESQKRDITMAVLGLGAQVGVVLPFSRMQEAEADSMGLTYMARAGYDPAEAITLWQRMSQVGGAPPEILSDHPDSAKRAEALKEQLPKAQAEYARANKVATQAIF